MQQGIYIAEEEAGTVTVCAILDGQIDRSVSVSFVTSDGSAQGIRIT